MKIWKPVRLFSFVAALSMLVAAGGAQAILPPPSATQFCGEVSVPRVRPPVRTGIWVDSTAGVRGALSIPSWSVQVNAAGWQELQLFTINNGRPLWLVTRPFQLGANGVASVDLLQRRRNPAIGAAGEETLAGEVAIAISEDSASMAVSYRISNGPATTRCFTPLLSDLRLSGSAEGPELKLRGRFERLATPGTLEQDAFVFADTGYLGGQPTSQVLLGTFDAGNNPVWFHARASELNQLNSAPLNWKSATADHPISTFTGAMVGSAGQFNYAIQSSQGAALTMPDQSQLLLPPGSLNHQLQSDSSTVRILPSSDCTFAAAAPDQPLTLLAGPNQQRCNITVSWNRGSLPDSAKLIRRSLLRDQVKALTTQSGEETYQLLPHSDYLFEIVVDGELRQTSNRLRVLPELVTREVLPLHPSGVCSATEADTPLPDGRWRELTAASGGWELESRKVNRAGSLIDQRRVTLDTWNNKGRPVWLRSEWVDVIPNQTVLNAVLRVYEFQPSELTVGNGRVVGSARITPYRITNHNHAGERNVAVASYEWDRQLVNDDATGADMVVAHQCIGNLSNTIQSRTSAEDIWLQAGVHATWPYHESPMAGSYSFLIRRISPLPQNPNDWGRESVQLRVFGIDHKPVWLTTPDAPIAATANSASRDFEVKYQKKDSTEFSVGTFTRWFVPGRTQLTVNLQLAPGSTPGINWVHPSAALDPGFQPTDTSTTAYRVPQPMQAYGEYYLTVTPRYCNADPNHPPCKIDMAWQFDLLASANRRVRVVRLIDGQPPLVISPQPPALTAVSNGRHSETFDYPVGVRYAIQTLEGSNWVDRKVSTPTEIYLVNNFIEVPVIAPHSGPAVQPGTEFDLRVSPPVPAEHRLQINTTGACQLSVETTVGTPISGSSPPSIDVKIPGCTRSGALHLTARLCRIGGFGICGSLSAPVTIQIGTLPPVPNRPTVVPVSNQPQSVSVTWNNVLTDSHSGYYQLKLSPQPEGTPIITAPIPSGVETQTTHNFQNLALGPWSVAVRACNFQDQCSDWSLQADFSITGTISTPPAAPTGFQVGPNPTLAAVNLNWTPVNPQPSHRYNLYYRLENVSNWSPGPANLATSTASLSLSAAGTYIFGLEACNAGNCSGRVSTAPTNVPTQTTEPTPILPTPQSPAASAAPSAAEILASSKVGSLDGSLRVNESGLPSFSMSVLTAPGKGGIAPSMTLSYDGSTAVGTAGVGFSLGGLSGITRCRRTVEAGDGPGPHPQVNFDADDSNDAFCLDGSRLLQHAVGTEAIDGVNHDYIEYRTELESFQRIRAYASPANASGMEKVQGPRFWRVEGKDGSIREYGRDYSDLVTRSAVYANERVSLVPTLKVTGGRYHILSWAISRGGDRLGNASRYRYETFPQGSADYYAGHYLSRVFYTRHDGSTPVLNEHAVLAFDYERAIAGTPVGWVAGSYSRLDHRLTRIRSCLRSTQDTIAPSELDFQQADGVCASEATTLRIYRLRYALQANIAETGSGNQLIPGQYGSGRSRLQSIQACADTAETICWSPTQLTWSNARAAIQPYSQALKGERFHRAAGMKFSDINGDGKPDVVWREALTDNQGDKLWLSLTVPNANNGTSFGSPIELVRIADALDNELYGHDPDRLWNLVDVNGDGLDDLISTESISGAANSGPWAWYVRYAQLNGSGFSSTRVALAGAPINHMTDIEAQFVLTDTSGDGIVDLVFPRRLGIGTSSERTILRTSRGSRDASGALQFGAAADLRLDFGQGLSTCYRVGFGRRHEADNWDSLDFDGDARADLTLRVQQVSTCQGRSTNSLPEGYEFGLDAVTPPTINLTIPNSAQNPAASAVFWGLFLSVDGTDFRQSGSAINAAHAPGAFRVADLNADGSNDLVYQSSEGGQWMYQLNDGAGRFGSAYCLLRVASGSTAPDYCLTTKLPNNNAPKSQLLLQDFNGDGLLDVWLSKDDPAEQLSDGGQRFAVHLWHGTVANNPGPNGCDQATIQCSDFTRDGLWTNALGGNTDQWRHVIVDLDADGHADSLTWKWADNHPGNYVLQRSNDHHQPRDVLIAVTSGYGASTRFSYEQLNFGTVHTRDFDAYGIRDYGRGSMVVDLLAPMYVVTRMETPAPTHENANNLASQHYRYQGLKMQLGGRGSLGFRKIYTLNAQNNVETSTEYHQRFPLTGRPLLTESRVLNDTGRALWTLGCSVDAPGSCFRAPPRCSSGRCPHFSGADANANTRGQLLARNSDETAWRLKTPGTDSFGSANQALPATHAIVFAYNRETVSDKFESASTLANVVIARTLSRSYDDDNPLGYDDYGNLLASKSLTYAGESTLQLTVRNTSVYQNNPGTWILGRLLTSNVTHERPGTTPVERKTAFEYYPNGQLKMERLQPGDAARQWTTYTEYHRFGGPSIKYSCSKPVEDANKCGSGFVQGSAVPENTQNWVYRFGKTAYEEVAGLPSTSYALRNVGGTPSLVISQQTQYNKWGSASRVTPLDRAETVNTFDHFGRAVHQYQSTGAQSTVLMARCGDVACPSAAVYRTESRTAGGSSQWVYADVLDRSVANLSESFKQGQYSLTRIGFDGLGRQIWQSEPQLVSTGPTQASIFPAISSAIRTESCYDVGGRVIYLKMPNHSGSFSCASPPTAAQQTSATPDENNVIQTIYRGLETETINGLGQAQTVTVNAMGETVRSSDANGYLTDFAYDATGNLISVTRGVGQPGPMITTAGFDVLGRREFINDPDAGTRYTAYNAAGEAVREIDAKLQCLESVRDFNGRVIELREYAEGSIASKLCVGSPEKRTRTVYDSRKLGLPESDSYASGDTPLSEAGAVSNDYHYDSLGRLVSLKRCIVAQSINRSETLNCRIEKTAYDEYGRVFWVADASSEGLTHNDSAYGAGFYRGVQSHYSQAGTTVDNVAVNPGFAYKLTKLGDSSVVYTELLRINARGQVEQDRAVGQLNFTTTRQYEGSTGRLMGISTGPAVNALQRLTYNYDEIGNLRLRQDQSSGRNILERFDGAADYDSLNRIKRTEMFSAGVSQGVLNLTYSSDGNILTKTGTGAYLNSSMPGLKYGSVAGVHGSSCAAGSLHAVGASDELGYCYDANGNQVRSMVRAGGATSRLIAYTRFDKPSSIDSLEVGGSGHSTRYGYGPAREMAWRIDIPVNGGPLSQASVEIHYFGGVERELRRGAAGQVNERYKRLIAGVLQIAEERVVTESSGTSSPVGTTSEVLLKDNLGSTHLIVQVDGSNPQYQRFDVFGMRSDASTGSTQTLQQAYQANNPNDPTKSRTRKGYTGHEMVDGAGIVHMQGRIYDPRLGRFLQADPIIQDPLNAQNYNRYTYVYNNPLSLTDPSGYRSLSANIEMYWKPAAAIAIAVFTGGQALGALKAGFEGAAAAWAAAGGAGAGLVTTGTLRGTVMGAVDGLLTLGIGQKLHHAGYVKSAIAAHALKGGMLEAFNGGDFGHGFLTAGLTKIAGLGVDELPQSDPVKIVAEALVGGTISELSGGNFATGAVSAVMQFAFNQLMLRRSSQQRGARYDLAESRFKELKNSLQGKSFKSELEAHNAFAGRASRITEVYGFELGANISQAGPEDFRVEELRLGLETGVGIPHYRGDHKWVAFTHTHPYGGILGFSGGARYINNELKVWDGDLGFAAEDGINAYVRTPSGRLDNTYIDLYFDYRAFSKARGSSPVVDAESFVRKL